MIYNVKNYFEYCEYNNIQAVYFCLKWGIDPKKVNKKHGNRNAFFYACEKYNVNML